MTQDNNFQITKDDKVSVSAYSELMNNYFPESTIKAGHDIRSLMVAPERPMVFCLDTDNRLQAILRKEGSASGWIQLMLSEGAVKSFELEYNSEEDSVRIAKVEDNKAWVSQELMLDDTDFESLETELDWESYEADNANEVIHKVSVGTEHMLFAAAAPGKDATYYVVNLEEGEQGHYTLPEHGMKVVQFELGNFKYTNGVFLLYDIGNERTLYYKSFPDPEYDEFEQARLETGEKINCFALLEGENGQDIIYAAGKNTYQFETNDDSAQSFLKTKLPGHGSQIQKIRVAGHDEERSVWTLHEDGLRYSTNRFYNQTNNRFETGQWTQPLLMVEGAEQFSCLKGKHVTNQLFTLSTAQGSELTRLWQDETTSLWNQHKVTLEMADQLKEVESYSAHIRFKANTIQKSFSGLKVRISADSNTFVYVNSRSYHIGPEREAEIMLGIVPEFTVICPVNNLAGSRLLLSADFLEKDKIVNLTDKVMARIEDKLPDAEKLGRATRPNGKLLVPEGTDTKTLKGAAEGIQQMLSAANELEKDGAGGFKKAAFAVPQAAGTTGFAAGNASIGSAHGHSLGDFLHSIWQAAKDAVSFVVEKIKEGIKFVIKIGEEIFSWIIKTLREIGGFIQKIFEAIKVFFEDLFEFLAFLFDWKSIVETKDAFKGYVSNALTSIRSEIGNIRSWIDKHLEAEIEKFSPELNHLPSSLEKELDMSSPPDDNEADPRANWLNSKKEFLDKAEKKMPTEFSGVMEKFIKDAQHIFMQFGEGFLSQLTIVGDAFKELFQGKITLLEFLKLLVQKLVGFSLFLVKQLIDLIFSALEMLLGVAQAGLEKEWHIPLISELYRSISGGAELSFLDALCLLVAIPTTVLYKIGEGEAPFGKDRPKEEFIKSGLNVFKLELN